MAKVFLNYARPDVNYAQRLVNDLKIAGLDVWFDQDSLLPGQVWRMEIKRAIKDCDYFIALLSTQSLNKRGFVHSEIRQALDEFNEIPYGKIFLIPARLDNCNIVHESLNELQWVDLFPDWNSGVAKIIRSILSS